jgi:ubiquinone/menaquinone biosynthesis C-methylase UbiE
VARQADRHPERYDPDTMGGLIKADHEARYRWAARALAGKDVLDAACGLGYGMRILVDAGAKSVVGIDKSAAAIERARGKLGQGAELVVGDLHELPFESRSFDAVVCFEAIEHVARPELVLDELKRVLREDGALLLSTPNRAVYVHGNVHHVHEYLPSELNETLLSRFRHVAVYAQHPWVASLITANGELAVTDPDAAVTTAVLKTMSVAPGQELFTLAVAGDGELPVLTSLTMLGDAVDVRAWQRAATSERDLELLRSSVSWRVTAPLRRLRRLVRRGSSAQET